MIYEQHFNSLSGLRFSDCPIAQFTLPQPSVLRLEIPERYGFCRAYFYADFPSPVVVKSIEITTVGALGTYGYGAVGDYLNFEVLIEYPPTWLEGTALPLPARTIVKDLSENTKLSRWVAFGIERNEALTSRAYVDVESVKITYESQEEPVVTNKALYRYKIAKSAQGNYPVYFNRDGVTVAVQNVEFKPFCPGGKILKFMDRNGLYRFFPFNEYWEERFSPDEIGNVEYNIDTLRSAQSDTRSLGYGVKKELSLVAYDVTSEELSILQDLFFSMRVYIYIGTTGDAPADWLLVRVTGGNNISRRRRGANGRFDVTIELPEQYTVTAL